MPPCSGHSRAPRASRTRRACSGRFRARSKRDEMALERIVKPHIRELAPYEPGKPPEELERELGIEGAIKLASNESPIGPSPRALAAVREALAGVHRYPDGACFDLRAALAKRFAVQEKQLVF